MDELYIKLSIMAIVDVEIYIQINVTYHNDS